jgi:hypothetical protein
MKSLIALLMVGFTAGATKRSTELRKASYLTKLLSRATPTENSQLPPLPQSVRRLDQQQQDDDYEIDITGYSLKFEKCQFVKAYDDELAEDKDSETVLATKRFVMFRLCPEGSCSSCNSGYGEYLVDLDSYLENTVQYFQGYQEAMCQACEDNCVADDGAAAAAEAEDAANVDDAEAGDNAVEEGDGRRQRRLNNNRNSYNIQVDCSVCYDECYKIQKINENGYLEASDFLQCQMIYDPDDDSKGSLYAGPICASSGSKIKIGVFSDENCLYLDSTKEVDDYLIYDGNPAKLSHALLKMTYSDTCVSCLQPQEQNDNNNNNQQQEAKVLELCQNLYEDAAKCEKHHGFDNGYANYYGYENQLSQETVVCDFMTSLMSGTYDESGEIVISGASSAVNGAHATTAGQKFALSFFVLGTVALAIYAAMLHSKLVRGARTGLSSTGGTYA